MDASGEPSPSAVTLKSVGFDVTIPSFARNTIYNFYIAYDNNLLEYVSGVLIIRRKV